MSKAPTPISAISRPSLPAGAILEGQPQREQRIVSIVNTIKQEIDRLAAKQAKAHVAKARKAAAIGVRSKLSP
jgi:hypothetical protein